MQLFKRVYPIFLASLLLLGCRQSAEDVSALKFQRLKAIMLDLEYRGSEMAQELDTLAHFYESAIKRKDLLLENPPPNPYRFVGPFSTNLPGQDSTLSSIIILNSTSNRMEAEKEVVYTNFLDSVFVAFKAKNNLAVQVYSNSALQVSRVYPAYDAKNIIDPNIDVTDFNFYYKADLEHNPSKGLVWIPEAYVDPAGKGWILSLIHPIYDQDKLFAVVGVDYTVTDLIEEYLESEEGEFILVNSKGDIVAGKSDAIELLSLPPLKNHVYHETVQSDYFRISDFNLFNSKSREVRKMAQKFLLEKSEQFKFEEESNLNEAMCVSFVSIEWFLIEVFPNY